MSERVEVFQMDEMNGLIEKLQHIIDDRDHQYCPLPSELPCSYFKAEAIIKLFADRWTPPAKVDPADRHGGRKAVEAFKRWAERKGVDEGDLEVGAGRETLRIPYCLRGQDCQCGSDTLAVRATCSNWRPALAHDR